MATRRRRNRRAAASTTPPARPTAPERPAYRKSWTWLTVLVIPMLVGGAIALYSSRLALDQAGEQEARAQSGANRAEDADLARFPAVLARVRQATYYPPYEWVFPQALSEATVAELAKPSRQWFETEGEKLSRDEMNAYLEELAARKRELGGVLSLWRDSERLSKSATKHLVSLVGNRREKIRVVDLRARVVERLPRMNGTLLRFPSEGSTPIEQVAVDLDDPSGRLIATDAEGVERPLLEAKSITLEEGEEIGLEINAMAATASYRWELEVTVEHGVANRETVRIRADGTSDGPAFLTAAWHYDDTFAGGVYRQDYYTYALVRTE
ncbi:hypothetical protein [Saccharothrix hoggarensis]|uniref:Uncharacterized protein n=1 Tax=Saccharothrix hoggarensis TaxID=913853 RepID=A0ABW3R1C4_9PSEU